MHEIKLRDILLLLLSGIFLLLSACSTGRKDGPPSYDVDVSKIPDAIPKVEARSKYNNLPSYRVFGKQYHVMASSKNYEEQGIASWYGTKFHARHTSSGERYNMLAMTAAHKTLPLPTYVQVTNLHNGKKIIVKVNDRGPFEANRIIDLSYVAAKKLGMLGHGTAYVDVKAIDPTRYDKNTFDKPAYTQDFYLADNTVKIHSNHHSLHYAAAHTNQKPKSALYLQVGAFKNKILAENMKVRVGKMVSSPIKITQLPPHKKLYRVQIGPIKDVATAKHITQKLKTLGVNTKQTLEEV
ncbi:MAG TPA: septal ring lytic transglycosylase RlpA family protein [Gammaproteobacteria bacterium]|nr:septal ring lytic transglycosylase RlpA family protein [Gammaproteobacteria bacterium]